MKAGFLQVVPLSPEFSAYWPYISLCKQGRVSLYENYFKITRSNLYALCRINHRYSNFPSIQ